MTVCGTLSLQSFNPLVSDPALHSSEVNSYLWVAKWHMGSRINFEM